MCPNENTHIYNKERKKKRVDEGLRDAPCGKGERGTTTRNKDTNRRTEKKKDIVKKEKENTCILQIFEESQCFIRLEMTKINLTNKAEQKSFPLNGRFIRVIGTSLDPSTLSGQKRLFFVKDCFHPAKDCTALTFGKQRARS